MRTYDEAVAESVDGFNADTVQTYRLLECFGIVFRAGIHLGCHVNELSQWYASSVVAYLDGRSFHVYGYLPSEPHHVFVNGVVKHLLEKHVDAVVVV